MRDRRAAAVARRRPLRADVRGAGASGPAPRVAAAVAGPAAGGAAVAGAAASAADAARVPGAAPDAARVPSAPPDAARVPDTAAALRVVARVAGLVA